MSTTVRPRRERPEADWDLVFKRNPVERIKRDKAPLGIRDELAAAVALEGEAAEVALAEATAVLAMVQDEERRGRLADLIAAIEDGAVEGESARALEELLELGLQTGRLRALYGPAGEQAALKTYRRLPGGKELADSAREVSRALSSLAGLTLEQVSLSAVGPGAYSLNLVVDGRELSLRLDRSGARVNSIVA